jgi:NAD+ diphosphatase
MAQADSAELTIDTTELEDAFWVDRAGVAAALAGDPETPFLPPPPYAIAHTLLSWWVNQTSPFTGEGDSALRG